MLRRVVTLTLLLAILAAGTISAAEEQMPYLQLVTTDLETYSLEIRSLQIRRFTSGETMVEAWVRTDYNKKAYLENMELIKNSTAPQEYAAKLSHSRARIIFSPRGRLAYLEHISYGYDGEELNRWREEEADWREVVPDTPGAVMLAKISEYASQEYEGSQPEKVLMDFLTWYVDGRLQSDRDRGVSDPLMTYAYMDRDDLTDNFKQHISAEMPRPGADPVLETQWIKELMEIGTILIRGNSARVSVYDYRFNVHDQQTPLLYFLLRQDGRWRVDRVERESQSKVAEGFYNEYKEWLAEGKKPLQAGLYCQSRFLTDDFKARLDAHVAAMNRGEPGYQFDPIMFGYELRKPETGYPETSGHVSTMRLSLNGRVSDKEQPRLKIILRRVDERWNIDAIIPESSVRQ